jgi:hypothetical protein
MRYTPAAAVAAGFGVSVRTARKWASRFKEAGVAGLADRTSRPKRCRSRLSEQDIARIFALRKERLTGDEIAIRLGFCRSSVFRGLRKLGLSRLRFLEEKKPIQRYQWEKPGQMLHMDIKKLGKIDGVGHKKAGTRQVCRRRPGWEYLHVCVDDASRAAYTAILPDEKAESAVEFLWFAVAWYAAHGIKIERALTDTALATGHQSFVRFAENSASSTNEPARTGPRQMARRNGLSERHCKNGHTRKRIPILGKELPTCLSGRNATISSVLTALLAENLQPQD